MIIALVDHCAERGIEFMSTPYGIPEAEFLLGLGVRRFKTASADIVDTHLHSYLADTGRPMIASTGMASRMEVQALADLYHASNTPLTLLHTTFEYPTPVAATKMSRLKALAEFGHAIDYSDHAEGSMSAIMAVALGATVLERQITLERADVGPDHFASDSPDEFGALTRYSRSIIRHVRAESLGIGAGGAAPFEVAEKSGASMAELGEPATAFEGDQVTRKIYEKQHARRVADPAAFDRIWDQYRTNTFGLSEDWFVGKRVLDIGCGNVGALIMRFIALGAAETCGVDIGEDWMPLLKDSLVRHGFPTDTVDLRAGSTLGLPFGDESFDFVSIDGVLIHLSDMNEVKQGFIEGARVCKSGGYYFTSYGPCGGLMQGAIFPAVRSYYRENPEFKALIDNLTAENLHATIDKVCIDAHKYANQDLNPSLLKLLFGEDFCLFLMNYIQAPNWLSNECTPEYVEGLYRSQGFEDIVRLNDYIVRTDIRKYEAPLHFDRDHPVSRGLYGDGYVQYVARKA